MAPSMVKEPISTPMVIVMLGGGNSTKNKVKVCTPMQVLA